MPVALEPAQRCYGARVYRWSVAAECLAEITHPRVILIELLSTRERAPRNELVDVGVACVVTDLLALDTGPRRRANDFARLGLQVAEANLFVLARLGKMCVIASGSPAERLPRLDRHLAVGLRGEHEDRLRCIRISFDPRLPLRRTRLRHRTVECRERLDLLLGVPADAFTSVTELCHERSERGKALVGVRVISLDDYDLRRSLPGHEIALAPLPVLHLERLGKLCGRVMQQRHQHYVLLETQVSHDELGELFRDRLVDLPVAAAFPH